MRNTIARALTMGVATAALAGAAYGGTALAQATDGMMRVGTDIAVGEYSYSAPGAYGGSYYLCQTTRCVPGEDIIDIDVVSGGATGYLSITPDVKFVKLRGLTLTYLGAN